MIIATFGPTTEWAGKTISRDGDVFVLEGHGPISASDVMDYDRQGHLVWVNEGTRAWVGSKAKASSTPSSAVQPPTGHVQESPPDGGTGAEAIHAERTASTASFSNPARPWWKRPLLVIPIVVGIVALVAVGSVIAWNIKVNSERKAAAREVLEPFQKLVSAVGGDITLTEYTGLVGTAQHYFADYKPSDAKGKKVRTHLKEALASFSFVKSAWEIEAIVGPDIAPTDEAASSHEDMWKFAVEDVQQAQNDAGL